MCSVHGSGRSVSVLKMHFRSMLALIWFSWSCFCFAGVENMMIRRRRQACENDTYTHNNLECCHCPSGYYVTMHCTVSNNEGKCEQCLPGFYRDFPSGEEQCEPCAVCQALANMEEKQHCLPSSNTVCGCIEGHYCDKGEDCRACYECDKCEDLGVKVLCTATNNTVCHEKSDHSGLIAAVVVSTVLVIIGVVLFLWWKKKLCFKISGKPPTEVNDMPLLDDKDLASFLPEIAQTLGWRTVKKVVESELTEVEIENAQHDNPNDTEERTLQVLKRWYQKQGVKGAYSKLINNLIKHGEKTNADRVKNIVARGTDSNC